jgi:hypothetical protein
MIDDLRSDDGLGGLPSQARRPVKQTPADSRSVSDREVPLGTSDTEARVLAPAVHAWLDGELPEASVRRGATAHDVEFWKRMNAQSEGRRSIRTPIHLEAQIMMAIPHTAPALITPWWKREFVVTPKTVVTTVITVAAATAVATAFAISATR